MIFYWKIPHKVLDGAILAGYIPMGDLVDALEQFVLTLQNLNHGLDFHKLKLLLVCDKHYVSLGAPKVLENIVF